MKYDFRKYLNPVFVETGSYQGRGIQSALGAGFKRIISIEKSEKYYKFCLMKFRHNRNVFLYLGDSVAWLPKILTGIPKSCTFWLDAHYSGGDTAPGPIPILKELEIIKAHPFRHTIMVDDMRLFRKGWMGVSAEDIEDSLKDYNIHYEFGVAPNDILIAT